MIDPNVLMLLLIGIVILVPIIPAYLLFHALDSSAIVFGPLKGFDIKLGGAFGGYFVTMLIALTAYSMVRPKAPYEVWEVNGRVTDTAGKPIEPLLVEDLNLNPSWLGQPDNGTFRMFIFTQPGPWASKEYPHFTIHHGDFEKTTINLDPNQPKDAASPEITWNSSSHIVTIGNISLSKATPYNSNAPALTLGPEQQVGKLVTSEHSHP